MKENYTDHMEFNFNRDLTLNTKPHQPGGQANIPKAEKLPAHSDAAKGRRLGTQMIAGFHLTAPLARTLEQRTIGTNICSSSDASGWKSTKTL